MSTDLMQKYSGAVPRYTSYPTAPHFHAGVNGEVYGDWLGRLPATDPVSLYVHIPFCDTLCWFCGCNTKVVNRYNVVNNYVDFLIREIEMVGAASPALTARHLHFGGGSPTMLQGDDVRRIVAALREAFHFADDMEFAIEVDPRLPDIKVLQPWCDSGLNRVSIGVQSFDQEVQIAINRLQSYEETRAALEFLRQRGVEAVNMDLMYGLPYQTIDSVRDTVEKILTLRPDRLALFGYAHVPWMKKHMSLIKDETLPGAEERLAQSEAAGEMLRAAGYIQIGLDHFALPEDDLARAVKDGSMHRNFQGYTTDTAETLIGMGASAIGSSPWGYIQNHPDVRAYRDLIGAGDFASHRGIEISTADKARRDVIERLMCDYRVDLGEVRRRFELADDFFAEDRLRLEPLKGDGLVEVSADEVIITETGRPFMRVVCAIFDTYFSSGAGRHSTAV